MRRIINVRLPDPSPKAKENDLWEIVLDHQDMVAEVNHMSTCSALNGDNWLGDFLSPMGIDLQMNGGLGLDFSDLNFDQLSKLDRLLDLLWQEGVKAICPTLISCSVNSLRLSLEVLRESRRRVKKDRCQLLGAHLEGPFLSPCRVGAHDKSALIEPSLSALAERIQGYEGEIAIVTLAPELPGAKEVIAKLKDLKVVIALGHSSADADSARNAFSEGVSMLTHTFNAMPGMGHRAPGPVAEAILDGSISMGLIADGIHVDPNIAVLLQRTSPKNIFLVSDGIAPYGLNDGSFTWDKRLVLVENGCCRLGDGTLAGTTLPLLKGVQNLAQWCGNPSAAIWSATMSPREALGETRNIAHYLIGQPFQTLLRWHLDSSKRKALFWSHPVSS